MSKPIPLVVRTISRTALGTAWRAYARARDAGEDPVLLAHTPLIGVAAGCVMNPHQALFLLDMYNEIGDRVDTWVTEKMLDLPVDAREGPVRTTVTREVLDNVHRDLSTMANYFCSLSFPLAVYRGMLVHSDDRVRLQGDSWTPNRAIAEAFAVGTHNASEVTLAGLRGRGRSVLLVGTLPSPAHVDWRQTFALFSGYSLNFLGEHGQAEEEIRVAGRRSVQDVREIPLEDA